ncbi:hypothetical protein [Occultella kanbiaonis]|nr:hypothetical protein [Occultella kanbiaonis]
MLTAHSQEVSSEEIGPKGLFIVGGTVKEAIATLEPATVRDH